MSFRARLKRAGPNRIRNAPKTPYMPVYMAHARPPLPKFSPRCGMQENGLQDYLVYRIQI